MTIWLPPVRSALYLYPLATISVLILLALIFKFAQAGGTVGLMTGGVLAFYVIAVIVESTSRQPARRRDPSPVHSAAYVADRPATACAFTDALRDANGRAPYAANHASAATRSDANSAGAPHASRLPGRDPEIRLRRPLSFESAQRLLDLAARDARKGRARVSRRRSRRMPRCFGISR